MSYAENAYFSLIISLFNDSGSPTKIRDVFEK
jgi:hypothetical protein